MQQHIFLLIVLSNVNICKTYFQIFIALEDFVLQVGILSLVTLFSDLRIIFWRASKFYYVFQRFNCFQWKHCLTGIAKFLKS